MKKFILAGALAVSTLIANAQINTPQPSPAATVSQVVGLAKVTIEYSRPILKGRKVIGSELAPYGKVWRTGANKIPNLIVSQDVTIEGNKVPAGTYGLVTIPTENDWTVILTKNGAQWGTYDYKEAEDLVRFKVKSEKLAKSEEFFTMEFTDFNPTSSNIAIRWENTQVKFNLKHDPDAQIMAQIKEKTSAADVKADTYFTAADYYFENNKDLKQALEWANKVIDSQKEYWTYALRGRIAAKLGNCAVAIPDAEKGLELAKKAGDGAYIVKNQAVLKACGK